MKLRHVVLSLWSLVPVACGGGGGGDGQDGGSSTDTDGTTTVGVSVTVGTVTTSGSVSLTGTAATSIGTTDTPPVEPCCAAIGEAGCSADPGIAECVCETDRYCCEVIWDDVCIEKMVAFGCGTCEPGPVSMTTFADSGEVTTSEPPQNVGPCCAAHPESGCEIPTLADCVCDYEPSCCDTGWHDGCVDAVGLYGCGVCPPDPGTTSSETTGGPDNSEACCATHPSTGCEYASIADCVCLSYPGCCSDGWTQICVDSVDALGCGVCP